MNDIAEIDLWPAALHQCPICGGRGERSALSIRAGGKFDGVQATCGSCDFKVESSEPDALRFTIEMFIDGGKALADAAAALAGDAGQPQASAVPGQ